MKTPHLKSMCVAFATNVIGDKWTPKLLSALAQGSLRFGELQEMSGGINPRTLCQRLTDLEEMGVIQKVAPKGDEMHGAYALTKKGEDLVPILKQMSAWGEKYQ